MSSMNNPLFYLFKGQYQHNVLLHMKKFTNSIFTYFNEFND